MLCFLIDPKRAKYALFDSSSTKAMHEESKQFERSNVLQLEPRPLGTNVISIEWVFKNKTDEHGTLIRNKARSVAQGYTPVEQLSVSTLMKLSPCR